MSSSLESIYGIMRKTGGRGTTRSKSVFRLYHSCLELQYKPLLNLLMDATEMRQPGKRDFVIANFATNWVSIQLFLDSLKDIGTEAQF
jgi:hypothetical protein